MGSLPLPTLTPPLHTLPLEHALPQTVDRLWGILSNDEDVEDDF